MVKHTQTILPLLQTNCLRVFNDFVGLALIPFMTEAAMDWFLYDNGLRHERVKELIMIAKATNIS